MGSKYASNKRALAICDVCGFPYKLRQLKALVVKGTVTQTLACPECWNPDHPQLHIGEVKVFDPQALRNPRSDSAELGEERANIFPVTMPSGVGQVGYVTISIV